MPVFSLPNSSRAIVVTCIATQAVALPLVASHSHRNLGLTLIAFFVGGFVTDFISGLAHFSFDYIWPARTPIMGPIAVDFRGHHVKPGLDPSAVIPNLTRGAYGALPIAIITLVVDLSSGPSSVSFLVVASLMATSIWMLGFHQIHSYAHMGSQLSAEEFNNAVIKISKLPSTRQQKQEFAKLFKSLGIPRLVRVLQRCRLFLRPEIHWQHHIAFESDFSSVNGWSDPMMNWLYGAVARHKKRNGWIMEKAEFLATAESPVKKQPPGAPLPQSTSG